MLAKTPSSMRSDGATSRVADDSRSHQGLDNVVDEKKAMLTLSPLKTWDRSRHPVDLSPWDLGDQREHFSLAKTDRQLT
jgi:hypothetical protein